MNENYDYQHQMLGRTINMATYEHIDFEYARKITCVNAAVLSSLALPPDAPQNVGVVVTGLTNSTTLKWKAPQGKTPKGYFVLMRETYQPLWEKKFFTDKTEITLPYSKDNYFFAVNPLMKKGTRVCQFGPYW